LVPLGFLELSKVIENKKAQATHFIVELRSRWAENSRETRDSKSALPMEQEEKPKKDYLGCSSTMRADQESDILL